LQGTYSIRCRRRQIHLTDVGKGHMKRLLILIIVKICGKALLITIMVGILIGAIGYLKKWDTSTAYCNAFFIAGCLLIIAGGSSRLASGQEWNAFQSLHAESFHNMSMSEQSNYIINASNSFSLVILGLISGTLLILISVIVMKLL
jgi:hypothetical protein